MLQNNLDPEVAEHPEELVVYGGIGRAARDWPAFDAILATLRRLGDDETLLVQSGKPVGVFRTHADAPRVLLANSNLVPRWATWEHFHELDRKGLMMYGQMTAGSWIYIGSQGIVQGTYETFAAVARQHFGGSAAGRWILTGGLGGMGGAQPLAATMAGFSMIAVECDPTRIEKRLETRYLDERAATLDEALARVERARRRGPARLGGAGRQRRRRLRRAGPARRHARRGHRPDQRPRPDPRLPAAGLDAGGAGATAQRTDPASIVGPAKTSMAVQVRAMLELQRRGAATFDYGNNLRQMAKEAGVADAFDFPGFVPAYIRPLFCEGKGPFRWVALSGDPGRHPPDRRGGEAAHPGRPGAPPLARPGARRIAFQGLPARICWVGVKDRARLGLAFNDLVRRGEVKAPIVIGRDHLDTGSVASPNRETEAMLDGSDAVSDWPLLNALLNTAGGATWVSLHHGGGVGMGFSQHAGVVIVADGTAAAARRLARVLWNDPATGVMRHADAGYPLAIETARQAGLDLPSLPPAAAATGRGDAMWDLLVRDARLVTMTPGAPWGAVPGAPEAAAGVEGGALAVQDGRIAWVGLDRDLPAGAAAARELDAGGRLLTPGLVDCHTHLIHAGSRAAEWEARLGGATYEAIAAAGGGILATVRATRAAGPERLLALALERIGTLLAGGVTTVEVKSGYGLDLETELAMLRAARRAGALLPVTVRTSYLGLHAVPPEYLGRAERYLELVLGEVLPAAAAARLADAVDADREHICQPDIFIIRICAIEFVN